MLFLSLVILACAACSQGVTVVGNPNEEIALPDAKSATIDYLKSHPIWKASDEELYNLIIDVDRGVVRKSGDEVKFEISDIGVLSTVDDSGDAKFAVTAMPRDLKKYPLDVVLVDVSSNRSADAFASDNTDVSIVDSGVDPVVAAQAKGLNCFDVDGDLTYDGRYFVKGFVQTHIPSTESGFGLRVDDVCTPDGKALQESVCVPDDAKKNSHHLEIHEVACNCHNGRCVDEVTDVEIPAQKFEYCDLHNCDPLSQKEFDDMVDNNFHGLPVGNMFK